jgi:hypothetical protein
MRFSSRSRLGLFLMLLLVLATGLGDKVTPTSALEALHERLRAPEGDPSFFVADSGIYSEANMRRFNQAKAVVDTASDSAEWHDFEDEQTHWFTRTMSLPQGQERRVVVHTEHEISS